MSHAHGAQYYIGEFSDGKFAPEHHGRMNWPGGAFFAPEQLRDGKGRNIIWGWVVQPRGIEPQLKKETSYRDYGWSGVMSLPRVVSFDSGGALRIDPPEEMRSIRLNELQEDNIDLQPNEEVSLRARGRSIELKLEMFGGDRCSYGVKVFASPNGREQTVIRYESAQEQLVIDFSNSSIVGPVSVPSFNVDAFDPSKSLFKQFTKTVSEQRAPLTLGKGEALELDIFLDRSIIEVFANRRLVLTQVVYPELDGSTGLRVFSGKQATAVRNIRSWRMAETNTY